jgi:small subunit ribosomal protein S4
MARNFGPRAHIERREKQDLLLFSGVTPRESKCRVNVIPGQHGLRGGRLSQYGKQFRAKQLAKRMYGILEKQFRNYFKKAMRKRGSTGEALLRLLECRLDNIVYRLGFARTRAEARQLVTHKGVMVKRDDMVRVINIPSFQVEEHDEISVREKCRSQGRIQEALEIAKQRVLPEWLEATPSEFKGIVRRMPERNEMPPEIEELLIVELYSK